MNSKTAKRRAKGLYWDRAWKLVEGCTKCSPGCDNCWSEKETFMRAYHTNPKIKGRAEAVIQETGDKFTGNVLLRHDNLDLPLRTKKPTVFAIWNDLFHEDVPLHYIAKVYAVMISSPQHTFLVLTKRSQGMDESVSALFYTEQGNEMIAEHMDDIGKSEFMDFSDSHDHIYHGVTVCNQAEADAKIPHLLKIPGKRFLSIEPMLGAIDLKIPCVQCGDYQDCHCVGHERCPAAISGINQVLLGGESGKNARPMHPDWVRSVRDQCESAGVPFYFKQWGEWCPSDCLIDFHGVHGVKANADLVGDVWHYGSDNIDKDGDVEFEPDVWRFGKKKAGRSLDEQLHDELIWEGEK